MFTKSSLNCCCSVTERWWLVAGLRSVGTRGRDPLLGTGPLAALEDVVLLTSLFGGSWAGLLEGFDSIGLTKLCGEAIEGDSGPVLDLGLLLWELGMEDSLLIQEPLDETDSLRDSSSKCGAVSSCRNTESPRPLLCFCISTRVLAVEGNGRKVGGTFEPDSLEGFASEVGTVVLVAGRDIGVERPELL